MVQSFLHLYYYQSRHCQNLHLSLLSPTFISVPTTGSTDNTRCSVCRRKKYRKSLHRLSQEVKRELKAYNTCCSQAVTHPGTEQARRCLTSVIRREPVHSAWYGRRRKRRRVRLLLYHAVSDIKTKVDAYRTFCSLNNIGTVSTLGVIHTNFPSSAKVSDT